MENTLDGPGAETDQKTGGRGVGGGPARSSLLLAALLTAVVLVAGGLRFFRLGAWSFTGDESATFEEDESLFGVNEAPPDDQAYRLPRLIPLAYGIQHLDYILFGRGEWGSRVVPALLGTLGVGLTFLLLARSQGWAAALAVALLVALSPDHLYLSQSNRHYSIAWLLASATMLVGAIAVRRRSLALTVAAAGLALVAVLAHSLLGIASAGLTAAVAVAGWLRYGKAVRPQVVVAALFTLLTAGLLAWMLKHYGGGWNAGNDWGYGVGHSLAAGLLQIGWPTALLAAVGAVEVLASRDADGAYWLTWAVVWAAATVLLPLVVVYHPGYGFMLSLGVFVLAGRAIGSIFGRLRAWNAAAAFAWLAAACLLGIPGTFSYFADGSRPDFRRAAQTVSEGWLPGDRIQSNSPDVLERYLTGTARPSGVHDGTPLLGLDRETASAGRVWIVLPMGRDGQPEPLRQWLDANCRRVALVRHRRFDYHEYALEVYLHPGKGTDVTRR